MEELIEGVTMENWKTRIKKAWDENPMQVVAIGAVAATAVAKVADSMSSVRSRRAYVRQVNYRVRNKK
jgi:Ni,Fe-hydrogenase III small subunit